MSRHVHTQYQVRRPRRERSSTERDSTPEPLAVAPAKSSNRHRVIEGASQTTRRDASGEFERDLSCARRRSFNRDDLR